MNQRFARQLANCIHRQGIFDFFSDRLEIYET